MKIYRLQNLFLKAASVRQLTTAGKAFDKMLFGLVLIFAALVPTEVLAASPSGPTLTTVFVNNTYSMSGLPTGTTKAM